jgi:hypothetical protein
MPDRVFAGSGGDRGSVETAGTIPCAPEPRAALPSDSELDAHEEEPPLELGALEQTSRGGGAGSSSGDPAAELSSDSELVSEAEEVSESDSLELGGWSFEALFFARRGVPFPKSGLTDGPAPLPGWLSSLELEPSELELDTSEPSSSEELSATAVVLCLQCCILNSSPQPRGLAFKPNRKKARQFG